MGLLRDFGIFGFQWSQTSPTWQEDGVLKVGGEAVGQHLSEEGAGCCQDEPVYPHTLPLLGHQAHVRQLALGEVGEAQVQGLLEVGGPANNNQHDKGHD